MHKQSVVHGMREVVTGGRTAQIVVVPISVPPEQPHCAVPLPQWRRTSQSRPFARIRSEWLSCAHAKARIAPVAVELGKEALPTLSR